MEKTHRSILSVILIEDRLEDAEIVKRELQKAYSKIEWVHVQSLDTFIKKLHETKPDLVLSDFKMPGFTGLDALNLFQQQAIHIPFIIVTGSIDEDTAVTCLKRGATDYVTKENIYRLRPAVSNAIELFEHEREKIAARKAFIEEQKKFSHAFEYANVGMCLLGLDGKFIKTNPEFTRIVGYSKEELADKTVFDITIDDDLEMTRAFYLDVQRDQPKSAEIQKRYRHKDGHPVWVLLTISLVKDDANQPIFYVAHVRDFSRRKKDEDSILKLSKSVEQSPVMVAITDLNGIIDYVNPKLEEVTGYNNCELKGETFRILKSGLQPPEFYETLWKTISSGNVWKGEICNRKKSGELYWESATISTINNSQMKPIYYLAIKEDITQWKRMERNLIEAKELAEASDRLKSAFLANISHEIRTPMNGILGFAELLTDVTLSRQEQMDYIQVIQRSGNQLLAIVEDILDISTIEAGQMKIRSETFELAPLLEDLRLLTLTRIEQNRKNIKVLLDLPASPVQRIRTDKLHLIQILQNLVVNAVKFTHFGEIRIGYREDGTFLEFFVKDTGIGIEKAAFETIFERFRQENDSVNRVYGGTGLGLSIAKGLVELMGGSISVDSTPGEGSCFTFRIPLHRDGQQSPDIENNLELTQCTGQTVLVVEDVDENYAVLRQYLLKINLKPIRAQNGQECLTICQESPLPRLILMDLKLPDANGLDITRKVLAQHPHLPIVAQTAFAADNDRIACLEAGCRAFISKPISFHLLRETLCKLLSETT